MVDLLVLALLCGLVTWRVASLLHTEDAFEWLRARIGIGHDDEGWPIAYPDTFLETVQVLLVPDAVGRGTDDARGRCSGARAMAVVGAIVAGIQHGCDMA